MANYIGVKQSLEYVPGMTIHWAGGRTNPPPDTPACGFDNSLCKSNTFRFKVFTFSNIYLVEIIKCVIISLQKKSFFVCVK